MNVRVILESPRERPFRAVEKRDPLLWLRRSLLAICVVTLGFTASVYLLSWWHQNQQERVFDQTQVQQPVRSQTQMNAGDMIGRISIPRLDVRAVVEEGVEEGTLSRAVGHLPGTAMPGQPGNVALAAHRDTFFRGLRNIRKDDVITIETRGHQYDYLVESTTIVKPTDVDVVAGTNEPVLTLVTCYPFYYIGKAPKRFIVRARQSNVSSRELQGS